MPMSWVEPELFLEYKGVKVYHCYDDGGNVAHFWYTTCPADDNIDSPMDTSDDCAGQFDVRDLSWPQLFYTDPIMRRQHAHIIIHNIHTGGADALTNANKPA